MYKKIDEYIAHLARNKSKHTVSNYELHLNKFLDWVIASGEACEPFELEQEVYLDYIDVLKSKYAPKTVHAHMTAIYSWLTFMLRKGHISKMPFLDSKEMNEFLPILSKRQVKVVSKAQLKTMLFVTEGDLIRECIIRVFYDTAMRVSELVNAKISDIEHNFDHITIKITGKGKGGMTKVRTALLTKKTYSLIQNMIKSRDFQSDYIFASPKTHNPFTTRRIGQIIDEIADQANVEGMTPHVFRASITTHLIENGMPIEYVSRYIGHANISTTIQNYTNLDRSLHSKFDTFHQGL